MTSLIVAFACGATVGGAAMTQGRAVPQGPLAAVPTVVTRETVILAAERLMVERMYPAKPRGVAGYDIDLPVDLKILMAAEQSPDPNVRAEFVRALGRFEEPGDVDRIILRLNDAIAVRMEAVRALPQALVNATPEKHGREIQLAFDALRYLAPIPRPTPFGLRILERNDFSALVTQSIGELPLDRKQVADAVKDFSQGIERNPLYLPALTGLAALARRHGDLQVSASTLMRLRILAAPRGFSDGVGEPQIEALEVLYRLHDNDPRVINFGAMHHCVPFPEGCWEFRYLAVQMADGSSSTYNKALTDALRDSVYHVRLAALRVAGAALAKTKTCAPMIEALNDPMPYVVLQAIDLLHPQCAERDFIDERLVAWANELSDPLNATKWQRPARALEALVKFAPDVAKKLANGIAAPHEVWQVRATAARLAGALNDEALALRLLKDDEPNVRTEALLSLSQLRSPKRVQAAIDQLESKDYQLVLMAARELSRAALGEAVAKSIGSLPQKYLMDALARLTLDKKDTSRDPRLELLMRIAEYADPLDGDAMDALREYLKDTDPVVATAAADTIGTLTHERPDPVPTRVPLIQPTEEDLRQIQSPPPGMTMMTQIELSDGGRIAFTLAPRQAPLTVYRFKQLADAGYYNGLTFHRVAPDLLIQGGSPGANEYMGTDKFWRDEIVLPQLAGSVAVSTRGRHTGDGQFFVDLLDAPQFDHLYTVFGTEACLTTHVLEGARIVRLVAFAPKVQMPPCVNITPARPRPVPPDRPIR